MLFVAATGFAHGHSIGDVEDMLGEQEKYFQTVDKPAPDFALRTADGRAVRLADLRGNAVVLNFVYTSCPDICPLHAERIAETQHLVNDTPVRDRVAFLTVTTDPSNDTPDVMRYYGPAHGLDPANWTFLTTAQDEPEDATRKLAEAYGHKFAKTEDGYQMHGIVTHVIDTHGRLEGELPRAPVRSGQPGHVRQRAHQRNQPSACAPSEELVGLDHRMTAAVRPPTAVLVLAVVAAGAAAAVFGYTLLAQNSASLLDPHDASVVARGQAAYVKQCAACHGRNLEGQPDWRARDKDGFLPAPPHDKSGHTWHHPDRLLFDITKRGLAEAANLKDYKTRMPAFGEVLTDDEIMAILSYIKSRWPEEVQQRHDELNRVYSRRDP